MTKRKSVRVAVLIVLVVAAYLVWTGGGFDVDYSQRDIIGTKYPAGPNQEIEISAILIAIDRSIPVPPFGYFTWAPRPNLLVLKFVPDVPGNSVTRIFRLDAVSGDRITNLLEFSRPPKFETHVIPGAVIDLPKDLGKIDRFELEASFGPSKSDQPVFEIQIPASYSPKLTLRTIRSTKSRPIDGQPLETTPDGASQF